MRRDVGVVLGALVGALALTACASPAPQPVASAPHSASPEVTGSPEGGSPSSDVEVSPVPSPATTPPLDDPAPPEPQFAATVGPITPELAARMSPSWRAGCPVPLGELRYLTLAHHDFDGAVVTGELVVNADAADAVTQVFQALFDAGYPIRAMRLVDDFGADDDASMAADNTSSFNCRAVAGTKVWSQHAYGRAIDINPIENPYVSRSGVFPLAGRDFAARPTALGVVHSGDVVVAAFADVGWGWGGMWSGAKDYQHFSASGR